MRIPELSARLACLLPGLDEVAREPVARLLEAHVRLLVTQSWTALVQACSNGRPAATAEALHSAISGMPDPEPLLARLGGAITPGLLLCLPLPDRAGVTAALLAHPDARMRDQTREHTLDAMGDTAAGCRPLRDACLAWSRRMLVAELGRIPELSHTDRLGLQERLLATGNDTAADEPFPEAHLLSDALRTAANRKATMILAERAGVAADIAELAVVLRDPKMLVALCWKAGCDPAEAVAVQLQLGHVPPDQVLRMGPDDQWPLDDAAMQRQIGILEDI